MRASFIKGRNTPWGSTQTPVGNSEMVPVPPLSTQVLVATVLVIRSFSGSKSAPLAFCAIAAPLPAPAGRADACQDMGPQAIIADAGHGFHGSRRGPGLDLGRSHLREHGVALLGIGRLLRGGDGRGELARSQLGLNACIRLIAPGCRDHRPQQAESRQEHQDLPQSTSDCSGS